MVFPDTCVAAPDDQVLGPDPTNPNVQVTTRGRRRYVAGLTGLAVATVGGATHGVLTVLITIRVLRRAIAAFKQSGAKLLAAVTASAMVAEQKQAIKVKIDAIKTAVSTLETNIQSAKERAAQLKAIKTLLEAIKAVLGTRLSTEYTMALGAYTGCEAASNSANRTKILGQSFGAAAVLGGAAFTGSYYAEPVQKLITQFVDNIRGGVGGGGGSSGICTETNICGDGMV